MFNPSGGHIAASNAAHTADSGDRAGETARSQNTAVLSYDSAPEFPAAGGNHFTDDMEVTHGALLQNLTKKATGGSLAVDEKAGNCVTVSLKNALKQGDGGETAVKGQVVHQFNRQTIGVLVRNTMLRKADEIFERANLNRAVLRKGGQGERLQKGKTEKKRNQFFHGLSFLFWGEMNLECGFLDRFVQ